MEAKRVSESRSQLVDVIFPNHMNYQETVFGGMVMQYIDRVAAVASMRHARRRVVTASSDSLDFLAPIRLGEAIIVEAFVTWTHRSSMEVFIKVESEDLLTGDKKTTATCFMTFVALDEEGKPTPVPQVIPETPFEKQLYEGAEQRYLERKKRKELSLKNQQLDSE